MEAGGWNLGSSVIFPPYSLGQGLSPSACPSVWVDWMTNKLWGPTRLCCGPQCWDTVMCCYVQIFCYECHGSLFSFLYLCSRHFAHGLPFQSPSPLRTQIFTWSLESKLRSSHVKGKCLTEFLHFSLASLQSVQRWLQGQQLEWVLEQKSNHLRWARAPPWLTLSMEAASPPSVGLKMFICDANSSQNCDEYQTKPI